MEDGDLLKAQVGPIGVGLWNGEQNPEAKVASDFNTHVEVITTTGEKWVGTFGPGVNVVMPPGAMSMTVSATASDTTSGQLELYELGPPGTEPKDFAVQGFGSQVERKDPLTVYLFAVDSFGPTGVWDSHGSFDVLAADEFAAHDAVQTWAEGHGLDFSPEIVGVRSAWTSELVDNQGVYEFQITCLNDQKSLVSGSLTYENGAKVDLSWSTMQKRNTPLWMSTAVLPYDLLPAGSESFTESFRIDLLVQNSTDGLVPFSFEAQVHGNPVP